ncbi:MAG: hypothetical protein IPL61_27535 [Myxococcales bacterium]|nr:hypothetical protein [Myxococcales bacterium]
MTKAAWIAVVIAGCGGGQGAPSGQASGAVSGGGASGAASGSAGDREPGFFAAAGAPAPGACAADIDCVVAGTLDDSGCCWSYRELGAVAQSRAYASWAKGWKAACVDAQCPSPPVPQERAACLEAVRCVAGRCRNSCE